MPKEEVSTLIKEKFGDDKVHSYMLCSARCFFEALSYKKKADTFKHAWLNHEYWWLVFNENQGGSYCLLCMKHKTKSAKNKEKNPFIEDPSVRFKLSAIKDHMNSAMHKQSEKSEAWQHLSVIHHQHVNKQSPRIW